MDQSHAHQANCRPHCNSGKQCLKRSGEHLDNYENSQTEEDVREDNNKKPRKRDLAENVNFNDGNDESSSVPHRRDSEEEGQSSNGTKDKVLSTNPVVNTVANQTVDGNSLNEQQNSIQDHMSCITENTQQQQQISTTNNVLDNRRSVQDYATSYLPQQVPGEILRSLISNEISDDFNDGDSIETVTLDIADIISWNKQISKLFLVGDMPREFFNVWAFCKETLPSNPKYALGAFGLKLVGPYDVLAGYMNTDNPSHIINSVLHWRYYYDPPEFQTIIASIYSQYHIGYFRDKPLDCPIAIVSNNPENNCIIQLAGRSLFAVIRNYIRSVGGFFAHSICKKLVQFEKRMASYHLGGRQVSPVANTFHTFGISVPYDVKTKKGYRPLITTDEYIQRILKNYRELTVSSNKLKELYKLKPILDNAFTACSEDDFGTMLELGIDIFCDGNPKLHSICKSLLLEVYNLLKRPQFATILQIHLANRREGQYMSIL